MKDLTRGPIHLHLVTLAAPVLLGMLTQIAYQLVDLYFITRISVEATAGVNAAGNAVLMIAALATALSFGTAPLVGHAVGRNSRTDANIVFNQAIGLSVALGVTAVAVLYLFCFPYLRIVAADAGTVEAGATFIAWMLPGIAMSCPMAALGSALRGTGVVRPTIVISTLTVLVNAALAPVLIAGWGTGMPLGVAGAGLATSVSVFIGVALFVVYWCRSERYLSMKLSMLRPKLDQWGRILTIGLPASIEFGLTFVTAGIVYYAIRDFGASAQAGFGVGARILQVILLPGLAVGFAAGPIAAQNLGAQNTERVRQTFWQATIGATAIMAMITVIVQREPQALVSMFDADAATLKVAAAFLQVMSWSFVAHGLIYICSSMFQGVGNTWPSLASAVTRCLIFSFAAVWLSVQPRPSLGHVWYLLTASIGFQSILSLYLLRREFARRLIPR